MTAAPQLLAILLPALAGILILVLLASAPAARAHGSSATAYRCGWCPRRTTASLLPSDAGVLTGAACGYGDPAAAAEGGIHIAAVSAGFFRGGRACGACYQLRCRGRTRNACAKDGVKVVVVSDVAEANRTAGGGGQFVLTKDAFAAMTTGHDDGGQLASSVDVEFRRIPCVYKSKNLVVKVDETSSRERGHLALRFLYQGGQTDIAAVEVAQAVNDTASGTSNEAAPLPTSWQYMTRREVLPSVWRTPRVPVGPLRLRLVVTAGSGGKWLRADRAVLPAEWQPGAVYGTDLRVTDIAANTCGRASCSATMDAGDDDNQLR
ncbi:hypothetical protein ZWY2020_000115 [Hordeum vulgare]|nr:hypothetical protein ZWY2020_000115 [Hordeum vulgare]